MRSVRGTLTTSGHAGYISLIGEMIAVDDQPFNIVNNQGTLTTCNEVRLLQRRILMSRSVELTR